MPLLLGARENTSPCLLESTFVSKGQHIYSHSIPQHCNICNMKISRGGVEGDAF